MEKETRVYGINIDLDDFSEVDPGGWNSMSDEWWMSVAEGQGYVWSLKGFEGAFNMETITTTSMYIRII